MPGQESILDVRLLSEAKKTHRAKRTEQREERKRLKHFSLKAFRKSNKTRGRCQNYAFQKVENSYLVFFHVFRVFRGSWNLIVCHTSGYGHDKLHPLNCIRKILILKNAYFQKHSNNYHPIRQQKFIYKNYRFRYN
jgi:hypothetical protein